LQRGLPILTPATGTSQ